MKQIPLNTQLFSASLVDVSYTYTYDLHGHDKSVEVVLKAINTSDTIEAIFLLVNGYNEDEVDVTSQWHFSQEDGYSIAKKIFYETFNQTLIISVTSAQTEVNIAGGNNFPPESSKYGIHLNDDIQIRNTDVKISELVALVQQLKNKLEKTTKLVFHGNYQRGTSTGIICLYLSAGQTIRPKFWSSTNANLTGSGFYYITFMNYEVK